MSKITYAIAVLVCLAACGDKAADRAPKDTTAAVAASEAVGSPSGSYDRKTFVLCPALEDHRQELAAIVGFQQDPERSLAISRGRCAIRGSGGDFVRVSVLPALVRSAKQYAEMSFDASASPLPEVGSDAMFVADASQPHVVFPMEPLIIDVNAAHKPTPDRDTMAALAARVREILVAAND